MTIEEIFAEESETLEFKSEIPSKSEKYMKTVVAFANGKGGTLVFGIDDNTRKIIGLPKEDVVDKVDAITNAIYDSCEPKIIPNIVLNEINGKIIIVVQIIAGMQTPYYIKSQGIMDGTYIRVAATTRHAEKYRIQELINKGFNSSFDQLALQQNVSEEQIKIFCDRLYRHALKQTEDVEKRKEIHRVGLNQLLSWKLLTQSNEGYHPTNGYMLLDGNSALFPEAAIQCAVFKGKDREIFITRKEFSGAIYEQIENAYNFVLQHIDVGARIIGIVRKDIYELPIQTIREIIANAVCHRSYLARGKIQVALFDDRLEVTSPGMLDREMSIEQMKSGLSKLRNPGIAAAFLYMNIIEAWGSGIPRIFKQAAEYGLPEPQLIDLGSDFRINLYRKRAQFDSCGVIEPGSRDTNQSAFDTKVDTIDTNRDTNQKAADTKVDTIDTNRDTNQGAFDTKVGIVDTNQAILKMINDKPQLTQKEIAVILKISLSTVKRVMKEQQQQGIILRCGSTRNGTWKLVKNDKSQ